MAQPTPYSLGYSFQGWQISNPNRPLPADRLENEYNNLALTLSQTLANLKLIQRDDTGLANQTVGLDQLKPELIGGIPQPTAWATNTPYKKGDTVFKGVILYRNLVAHTSGTFASDLAIGYWLQLADLSTGIILVNTFNGRTGALVPLVGDYSAFYQGINPSLTAISGLTSAADQLPYFTGSGTAALTSMPSYARSLIAAASASAARGTLGLAAIAASGSTLDLSGTLQAAQFPALTGDVTTSAGALGATIAAGAVTNAKMASGAAVANIGYTPTNKAGDTVTGNFILSPASGNSLLVLNHASGGGSGNTISGQTNGVSRWLFLPGDGTAESGGNAGSDFSLYPYSDVGTIGSPALTIYRATSNAVFGGNITVPASGYHNFGATLGASGYGFFDRSGTLQAKNSGGSWSTLLKPAIWLSDFTGFDDTGATDIYATLVAALAAASGGTLFIPKPSSYYKIGTATITIPPNTKICGMGMYTTKLQHAFNGDMFILSDGAAIQDLYLEGDGANFTGGAMVFNGTDSRQIRENLKAINFQGAIELFALNAGSQSFAKNVSYYRTGGTTGTNLYSVVMSPTQQLGAVPKIYVAFESNGYCSFDFGGSNDCFITGSFLCDLKYTADSRGVQILGGRIANQVNLTVNGHNNTIVGTDINPQITIASGADNCHIGPNSYNQLPVIDNSGNNRNTITHPVTSYTPAITSGGVAFALGNGTLAGNYCRTGSTITIQGELDFGTTTTFGTGGYSVSLPQQRNGTDVFCGGTIVGNRGGTIYQGFLQIAANATTAAFSRDTTSSITFNSPGTWAAGDTLRWTLTYTI